jgi:hypothetical protein
METVFSVNVSPYVSIPRKSPPAVQLQTRMLFPSAALESLLKSLSDACPHRLRPGLRIERSTSSSRDPGSGEASWLHFAHVNCRRQYD